MTTYDEIIPISNQVNTGSLDQIFRAVFGSKISGTSTGPQGGVRVAKIHFLVEERGDLPPPADIILARQICAKLGALQVFATKQAIVADGVDVAVITCNDVAIAGDTDVWVTVWLDGQEYMAPTLVSIATIQSGINLKSEFAGRYQIEIKRDGAGKYESGYVTVQATEAG